MRDGEVTASELRLTAPFPFPRFEPLPEVNRFRCRTFLVLRGQSFAYFSLFHAIFCAAEIMLETVSQVIPFGKYLTLSGQVATG